MVAESNEALMEEFFDKGTLPVEDLTRGLRDAIAQSSLFPVLPASSDRNVGVHSLLHGITALLPSPEDRGPVAGTVPGKDDEVICEPKADEPLAAFIFKTLADPHAGRVSLFRVYSGTLKADSTTHNATRDSAERIGALSLMQGKNQIHVAEVRAGDIGAVAKLKDSHTSDTLSDSKRVVTLPRMAFNEPATTFAIEPKSRGDEDKISSSLRRLMEEDPVLRVTVDPQTHELLLSGMGQLHIEVIVARLKKRFKVEVDLKQRKIPYQETIRASADGHGRHKKTDGRPWTVRRLQADDVAAPAQRGLRVRQQHLRRLDPEKLHPGRGEGRDRDGSARLPGGIPGRGFQGRADGRPVPRRRLLGDSFQDRGLARLQRRHRQVQADVARADNGRRDRRPRKSSPER